MNETHKNVPSPKEQLKINTPYDLLYDGINLTEKIGANGQKLIVPRTYLFGTQELSEYSQAKRKQVIREFEQHGEKYMQENPVIVLGHTFEKGIQLIIIDGHHRVRYAPKFGIVNIPCLIVDSKTLTAVINKTKDTNIDPEEFSLKTLQNVANALNSFDQRIVNYKSPQFVFGVNKLTDLNQLFIPSNHCGSVGPMIK